MKKKMEIKCLHRKTYPEISTHVGVRFVIIVPSFPFLIQKKFGGFETKILFFYLAIHFILWFPLIIVQKHAHTNESEISLHHRKKEINLKGIIFSSAKIDEPQQMLIFLLRFDVVLILYKQIGCFTKI